MQSLLCYIQDTDVLTAFISLVCVKLFNVNQKKNNEQNLHLHLANAFIQSDLQLGST